MLKLLSLVALLFACGGVELDDDPLAELGVQQSALDSCGCSGSCATGCSFHTTTNRCVAAGRTCGGTCSGYCAETGTGHKTRACGSSASVSGTCGWQTNDLPRAGRIGRR